MIKNFTITPQNLSVFIDNVKRLDPTRQWVGSVVEKKSKRSSQQRKWARKFASEFGKQIGYEPDEAYDILMFKCNPVFIIDPVTKEEIRMPGHFGDRDTKEGAEVQERMIRFGESVGFYWEE